MATALSTGPKTVRLPTLIRPGVMVFLDQKSHSLSFVNEDFATVYVQEGPGISPDDKIFTRLLIPDAENFFELARIIGLTHGLRVERVKPIPCGIGLRFVEWFVPD